MNPQVIGTWAMAIGTWLLAIGALYYNHKILQQWKKQTELEERKQRKEGRSEAF